MRAMVYTGATATAAELHAFGSVLRVVPRDELRDAALEVAADIAEKSPTVIRAAKESLNGIDLWDVKRSYRFEQGFTFELNLSGVSDELRDAFVDKRDADTSDSTGAASDRQADDEEDVVAELRDGMTVGIGGWGSRRKPMALVRALARSDRAGPHASCRYGGPDVGLLCRAGKVHEGRLRVRVARLDRARAALPQRPPVRRGARRWSSTRACSCSACRPRRGGCRSCRPASASAPT